MNTSNIVGPYSEGQLEVGAVAGAGISDTRNPRMWLQDWAMGGRQTAGQAVSPATSLFLPPYYAGMRLIAEDLGGLPCQTLEHLPGGGKRLAPEHSNYELLLNKPNSEMTPIAFYETVTGHAVGWHGGYAEIQLGQGGTVANLWPIHPSRVEIKRDRETGVIFYRISSGDILTNRSGSVMEKTVDIVAELMIHIHGIGADGTSGYGAVSVGREAIGVGLAQQEYAGSFFANGAFPGAVLKHPKVLSVDAAEKLRASWATRFGGAGAAHKPAVLEEGMDFVPFSIDPKQSQMIEQRRFTVEDIARLLRIPLHMLSSMERATFSNITEQAIEYVKHTMRPWAKRWEQELNRKIFTRPSDAMFFPEFNFHDLLRGDPEGRAKANAIKLANGALTDDEWRSEDGKDPLPDGLGTKHWMAANLVEIGAEPPPAPPPPFGAAAPEPEPEPDDDTTDASTALLASAMARVIQKESNAMARLAKKHSGDAEAFGTAVGMFYSRYVGEVSTEMAAAANLAAAFVGCSVDAEAVVACAEAHCSDCSKIIRVSFGGDTVENTLEHWKTDAASIVAARLYKAAFGSNDND